MFTEHMHALYVHFQIINIFLCTKFRNTGRKASRLARASDRFRRECKYISLLQTMYLYVVFILQYQKVQIISHFVLKDKKKTKNRRFNCCQGFPFHDNIYTVTVIFTVTRDQ
jgi:hypothetical protein